VARARLRNWYRRAFRPAAVAAGVPHAVPYDLRHIYASLRLAEQRLSLQEIAEEMGHSVQVLAETNAHVIAELRGEARSIPTS
jgi:integrase